jgi:glycosyltransferase involved in cell wall biosynthesis
VGLAYVQHYGSRSRAVVRLGGFSFVFPKAESDALFLWLLKPNGRFSVVTTILKAILNGVFNQHVAGAFLFNTGHSGLERNDYSRILRRMQVMPIFVVHDLIPLTHPEFCRAGESGRHVVRMNNVLDLAVGVIVNSQATLDELSVFAQRGGYALPTAVVGLLAPGVEKVALGKRPMQYAYFVILSTIEPRKNHWLLLQIWRGLVGRLGDAAPRLVLIGQRGWECENVVDMLERCSQLKGYVFELPNCSDAEMVNYLQHAQALLFPSFVEGYGMPLVEALALGVPVIASDLPVFKEIAGDIPEYVDPLDGKRWIDLIERYSVAGADRNSQLERLRSFSVPTWETHFATVDSMLDELRQADNHA